MSVVELPCDPSNYGGLRGSPVMYLVIHYTANNGDTARGNGNYFAANQNLGASAHWFVDENEWVLSVPEDRVAWHCGGAMYNHPACRNGNSIGVELCSRRAGDGTWYFTPETVANAQSLVRELMAKYNIPVENVIRHYDVTGKICPAPFVGAGKTDWEDFLGGLTMYKKLENVPDWAKPTVQRLMEQDILLGDENGDLNLSGDMVRTLVILDRAGVFDTK